MLKFIGFLLFLSQVSLAFLVHDDEDYFVYRTSKVSYILPRSDFKHLPRILGKSFQAMSLYETEFDWVLDERTSLIVTSNKNQIANAFATIIPNNMVVYYKGGVEFLGPSATSSWIDTLSSHEIAHVYQLNVKNRFGSVLKSVFGNQIYVPFPTIPVPLFISPTLLLPTFIVEGNAVLNESKLNQGGRLFSGEYLTMATELINDNQAELRFIMNNHLNFPFGAEKYILGGYFQASLASRFDFITINRFFKNHAENNINPFDLKSSFAATFFSEYEDLYARFLYEFKEKQKDYASYKGAHLASSIQNIEFSRIDESVYFLSMTDGKNPKYLNRYDILKKEISSQPSTLKSGKVFKLGDTFVTAATYNQNDRNIFYTLLDEDYNYDEIHANKYVTDIKSNFMSYFDMNDSFDSGSLYRNQEKIATTESKGLLDLKGNIYYFKQDGSSKGLYKNFERLTIFESHSAVLADVIDENEIYFVSNSKNGSSLYCFCVGKIERVLPYDNVVSAVKTGDGFLVNFQYSDSYRAAYVSENLHKIEVPFKTTSQFPEKYFRQLIPVPEMSPNSEPEKYRSLKELRYSKYSFNYLSSKNHSTLINSLNWTDPLFYSTVNLVFSLSNKLAFNALSFNYSPYSTQFRFGLLNETDFYSNETKKMTTNGYRISATNSLYEKQFQSVVLDLDYKSEKNGLFKNEIATAQITYTYLESYALNYLPYTYFSFTPSIEKSLDQVSQSFQISLSKMIFTDFYLRINAAKIDSEYYKLEADTGRRGFIKKGLYTPLYLSSMYSEKLTQGDLEMLYEIPYSKYYYRFPVSLRRLAPYLGFQKNRSEEFFYGTKIDEITYASVGIESELLFFHTNPVKLRLFSTEIIIQEKNERTLNIQISSGL